jgi:hypothetical protein
MSPDAKRAGFRPFSFRCRQVNVATRRVYRYLNHILFDPDGGASPLEIPRLLSYHAESFSLSVSGAGALALVAGGLFSVFYIVNALHQKEAEIRQEFN